jgi:putative transposase
MSQYRRLIVPGGTYFFTQVTEQRRDWLCEDLARKTLRQGIIKVQSRYPFTIDPTFSSPTNEVCKKHKILKSQSLKVANAPE